MGFRSRDAPKAQIMPNARLGLASRCLFCLDTEVIRQNLAHLAQYVVSAQLCVIFQEWINHLVNHRQLHRYGKTVERQCSSHWLSSVHQPGNHHARHSHHPFVFSYACTQSLVPISQSFQLSRDVISANSMSFRCLLALLFVCEAMQQMQLHACKFLVLQRTQRNQLQVCGSPFRQLTR